MAEDGSLVFDTELDNTGFEKGSDKLLSAIKDLTNAVDNMGDNMMHSFQAVIPLLKSISGSAEQTNNAIAESNERAAAASERMTAAEQAMASAFSAVTSAARQQTSAVNAAGESTETLHNGITGIAKDATSLSGSLDKMESSMQNGFSSASAVLQFKGQLDDAEAKLESLRTRLASFGEQKLPTEDYIWLSNAIDATTNKLVAMEDRQAKMQSMGVKANSKQWRSLEYDIEQTRKQLADYQIDMQQLQASGGDFIQGSDTAQYKEMDSFLSSAAEKLRQNKALIDAETIAQAQLNVKAAQEAVIHARNESERRAALDRLRETQESLTATAAQSANGSTASTAIGAPSEQTRSGWAAFGEILRNVGSAALRTTAAVARMSFRAAASGVGALVTRLKGFIKQSKKTQLTANGLAKALTSIKRILIGRIKGLFLSQIFDGVKKGIQELAKFSSAFNAAMSNIKNRSTEMSANLSVSIGGLIAAVEPTLTTIIDMVSRAISYLNAFFALLSGKTTVVAAKKQTEDYAKSLDGAAESAKELKNQVYGFDELNRRTDDSSGSGGSDGKDLFEETPLENLLPGDVADFFASIKKAVEEQDWSGVGDTIAAGLNSAVGKVNNWIQNTLRPKAAEWSKNVAEVLNGLIAGFDWALSGETLANGLNAIIDTVNTFLTNFNAISLGNGIGDAINGWFITVEWDLLGTTVSNGINRVVETINALVTRIDFAQIGSSISTGLNSLFNGVQWGLIGTTVGNGINGLADLINTAFDKADFKQYGEKISESFNGLFSTVKWSDVGAAAANGFNTVFDFVSGTVNKLEWGDIGDSIAKTLNSFSDKIHLGSIADTVSGGLNGISTAIQHFADNFNPTESGRKIGEAINKMFSDIRWGDLGTSLMNGLKSALQFLSSAITTTNWFAMGEDIQTFLSSVFDNIPWSELGTLLSDSLIALLDLALGFMENFDLGAESEKFKNGINKMLEAINWGEIASKLVVLFVEMLATLPDNPMFDIVGNLKGISDLLAAAFEAIGLDGIAGFFKGISDSLQGIKDWIKTNLVDPVVNAVKDFFGIHSPSTVFAEIGDNLIAGLLQGIENTWNTITGFFSTACEGLQSFFSGAWDGIKSAASTAWEGITNTLTSAWDGISSTASIVWDGVTTTVSSAWDKISTTTSDVWENIKSTVSAKFEEVKKGLYDTASSIKSNLSATWNSVKNTASTAWANIKTAVSNKFTEIKNGLSTTAGNIKDNLSTTWDNVKSSVSTAWTNVKTTITNRFTEVKNGLATAADNIKTNLSGAWDSVKSAASSAWSNVKTTVSTQFNSLKSGLSTTANSIRSSISSTWSSVQSAASSSWSGISSTVSNLWNGLRSTLSQSNWSYIGSNLVSGLQQGISNMWSSLTSWVSNAANNLTNTLRSVFDIHSPSREWAEIGEYLDKGLIVGLDDEKKHVLSTVANLANDITGQLESENAALGIDVGANELTAGLSGIATQLSDIAATFRAIGASITHAGGFAVPEIATGTAVPYRTRIASVETDSTAIEKLSLELDETLSDQTYILRQILELIQRLKLNIDIDSLTEAITGAQRRAERSYGGV